MGISLFPLYSPLLNLPTQNILISHLKTNEKPQLLKLLGNAGQVLKEEK